MERRRRSGLMYGQIMVFSLRLWVSVDLLIWELALLLQLLKLCGTIGEEDNRVQAYNVNDDLIDTVRRKMKEGVDIHLWRRRSTPNKHFASSATWHITRVVHHKCASTQWQSQKLFVLR